MRSIALTAFGLMTAVALAGGAGAAPPVDLAASFGERPAAWGVAVSPDGNKISYLGALAGSGTGVVVADVKAGTTKVILTASAQLRPYSCKWKTDARLVCLLYGVSTSEVDLFGFTRIIAIDADGSHIKQLGQRSSDQDLGINADSGSILNWLPDDPDEVLMQVSVIERANLGTAVVGLSPGTSAQRININTGLRSKVVEAGNKLVANLDADATGAVRFRMVMTTKGTGYVRDGASYSVRPKDSHDWKSVGTGTVSGVFSVDFAGFDESGDNIFMLKKLDGRLALYKLATDGSMRSELLFSHPIVDVNGVLRIGKYRRPVAATYTVDSTEYSFFDPALVKLSASLSKALPGSTTVDILDESWDGNRKLVFAGSDGDPGRYFMFDKTTHELNELVQQRPGLADIKLAKVTAIKFPARDGTMIPAYLTMPVGAATKNLPTIIMPHGGPSSRDELGFDWLAQFFAAQGYAVLQANFRGSSGYGAALYANNGFQSWPIAIGDINDGARWMAAQGTADPKRVAIFGWSYGGYAALQGAATEPGLYKAVVAVAPVTDLGMLKDRAKHYSDYTLVANFVGEGPFITTGSPARNAAKITVPVLMFHGDRDINVNIEQSQAMKAALKGAGKNVELIVYPGLDHQLDDNVARTDMLRRSAAFIGAALGK